MSPKAFLFLFLDDNFLCFPVENLRLLGVFSVPNCSVAALSFLFDDINGFSLTFFDGVVSKLYLKAGDIFPLRLPTLCLPLLVKTLLGFKLCSGVLTFNVLEDAEANSVLPSIFTDNLSSVNSKLADVALRGFSKPFSRRPKPSCARPWCRLSEPGQPLPSHAYSITTKYYYYYHIIVLVPITRATMKNKVLHYTIPFLFFFNVFSRLAASLKQVIPVHQGSSTANFPYSS